MKKNGSLRETTGSRSKLRECNATSGSGVIATRAELPFLDSAKVSAKT